MISKELFLKIKAAQHGVSVSTSGYFLYMDATRCTISRGTQEIAFFITGLEELQNHGAGLHHLLSVRFDEAVEELRKAEMSRLIG